MFKSCVGLTNLSVRGELVHHVRKIRMTGVARGKNWFGQRPGDREPGVVPCNPKLARRIVEVGRLVFDLGDRAHHDKPVREPGGYVNLLEVFRADSDAYPATEGLGAAANIDRHVEDLALD